MICYRDAKRIVLLHVFEDIGSVCVLGGDGINSIMYKLCLNIITHI
jgi:hypothetical protein